MVVIRMSRKDAEGEDCLIAAEQIQRKLMAIKRKVEREQDATVGPNNPLPVDVFLDAMVKRVNAPRIIFQPKRLNDLLWTESLPAYVYACIERAFVKAGLLPGGKRAGHKAELQKLKRWVQRQKKNPDRKVPNHFVENTVRLFAPGILKDRRSERLSLLWKIRERAPTKLTDLNQLDAWIDEDLSSSHLSSKGRSKNQQKIAFANEIAKLWQRLTGQPAAKGPNTNFGRFVVACWESGFVEMEVNSNFKRTLRDHVEP
jgi:hypothetical protein